MTRRSCLGPMKPEKLWPQDFAFCSKVIAEDTSKTRSPDDRDLPLAGGSALPDGRTSPLTDRAAPVSASMELQMPMLSVPVGSKGK